MTRVPEVDLDPTELVESAKLAATVADETKGEDAAELLTSGTLVGDYQIEGKIGSGGMGVVYSAVHPLIGKRAAVKVLRSELCRDPTVLARFLDEARAVNKIGHPNIVDIFSFGTLPDKRSYLVMEWLAGESLRARAERSRLELAEICHVLRALCRALDAAHDKGIVHRDLKPDNVFLVDVRGDRPLVKLLDFGIAKLLDADQRVDRTATQMMLGTPLYIPPEQARGEEIDARADIYSLGALAYELLVGQPPFVGRTAVEVVAKHLMEPVPRPSTRARLAPELDALLVGMLAKSPADRPSLADVVAVLDRIQGGRLEPARPSTPPPTLVHTPPAMPVHTQLSPYAIAAQPTPAPVPTYTQAPVLEESVPARRSRRGWVIAGLVTAAACAFALTAVALRDPATPPANVEATTTTPSPAPAPTPAPAPAPTPAATATPEPAAPVQAEPSTPVEPPPVAATTTTRNDAKPAPTTRRPTPKKPARPRRDPTTSDDDPELLAPGSLKR